MTQPATFSARAFDLDHHLPAWSDAFPSAIYVWVLQMVLVPEQYTPHDHVAKKSSSIFEGLLLRAPSNFAAIYDARIVFPSALARRYRVLLQCHRAGAPPVNQEGKSTTRSLSRSGADTGAKA